MIDKLLEEYEANLNEIKKISDKISYFRAVTFLLTIICLFFTQKTFILVLAIILIITFITLVVIHIFNSRKINDLSYKILSIKDYKIRKSNKITFEDLGTDFIDQSRYYQNDLDIFGKNSIYQYINVAKTPHGRASLASKLDNNDIAYKELINRQEAVSELSSDFRREIDMESVLKRYDNVSSDKRLSATKNALNLINNKVEVKKYFIIPIIILFLVTCVMIILSILGIVDALSVVSILFINFLFSTFFFRSIDEVSNNMVIINKQFNGIEYIVDCYIKYEFKSSKLKEEQDKIKLMSSKEIKQFNRLNNLISSRKNLLFSMLFNSTLFIDYFLLVFYKKWQDKNGNKFETVLTSIGEIESYLSLAVIKHAKDVTTMPIISEEFKFEDIIHPLMLEDKAVGNSFNFAGLNIITGSNMSGKTTFMRSIGTNYMLFKAGGYVCASDFKAPIASMYTSMRVVDDMSNGVSTFYGEILRIKDIVSAIDSNEKIIVLIDEIFKGTNTVDRIEGASSVAKLLNDASIISIITTHDFELCDLPKVSNYHFLEHYKDNKIYFDYLIKNGISKTKNAIYLLKMAGVIKK